MKKTIEIYLFLSGEKLVQESLNCRKYLEDRIVEQARNFYKQQSQALLQSASLSEYLHHANRFYNEEKQRTERYLTWDDIRDKVIKEFRQEMLLVHL